MNLLKKNVRDSNMELFRVVSMLLVLIVHTDYLALGRPTHIDALTSPTSTILRNFVEAISIICVNCFILISGWYGIKPKVKKISGLLFNIFFIYVISTLAYIVITGYQIEKDDIKAAFLLTGNMWFVKAYLFLYIISPVLNAFSENASKKQFLWVLAGLFFLQTLFGWAVEVVPYFAKGYSPLSFIILYLLSQYLHRYPCKLTSLSAKYYIYIYLSFVLIQTTLDFIQLRYGVGRRFHLNSYASPIVIMESVSLLLFFSKLSFKSKFVNWLGVSCFSAYLVHSTRCVVPFYLGHCKSFYEEGNIIGIACVVILTFSIGILFDKIRIIIWKLISSKIWREQVR